MKNRHLKYWVIELTEHLPIFFMKCGDIYIDLKHAWNRI